MKIIKTSSFRVGNDALLERSDLLVLLGLVAVNWSQLEEELALLYAYLLGQRGEPEEYGKPVDALGVQMFFEVASLRQRQRILTLCVEDRMSVDAARAFEKDVIKLIDSAAKLRNRYIHTRLAVDNAYPDALVANPLVGDLYLVEAKDIQETLDKIEYARQSVVTFNGDARRILNKPSRQ